MFRGVTHLNLDAKGRMAFPSRYRDRLMGLCDGEVVATIDYESPCLMLYPLPEWEVLEQQLVKLPTLNPQARRLQRLLIGHAHDLQLDGSGRVLLPQPLRDYADLNKKIVLVGQVHRFELWDADAWEQARTDWLQEAREEGTPEELGGLTL